MTEVNSVRQRIKNLIVEKFPLARQRDINDGDRLLETGILDSLGVLDLITCLEQEFMISVSDEELTPENFQTIECLTAFVERKKTAHSG